MQTANRIFKILFVTFLLICIGVHVYGLFAPITHETTASHLVHIASYSLCLLSLLAAIPGRIIVYLLAAVYPFMYHAHCAWASFALNGRLNGICILVVIMMPLGGFWIWKQR